jgi:transcriptional regulator with XRE-family HTH domain
MNTPLQRARQSDTRQLSQEDVAAAIGVTQSYYSKVERGIAQATPENAEKLVAFFGNRVSEIEVLYPDRFALPHTATQEPALQKAG